MPRSDSNVVAAFTEDQAARPAPAESRATWTIRERTNSQARAWPFPGFALQGPVARERRIHRRQLRGQLRISFVVEAAKRTEFLFGRSI